MNNRRQIALLLVLIVGLALASVLLVERRQSAAQTPEPISSEAGTETTQNSAWEIQTVDDMGRIWTNGSRYTSLAVDQSGNPHISYAYLEDEPDDQLKYARWTGSTWDIQVVTSSQYGHYWYPSLALDSGGNPHISYFHRTIDVVEYAYWTGTTWDVQSVDFVGWDSGRISLALDSADCPHISYHDAENDALKYAYWNGAAWDIQSVADGGRHPALALDSSDHPHLIYDDGGLMYTHWTGAAWDTQLVEATSGWTSLALDEVDHPHISNTIDGDTRVEYVHWTGSAWESQVVDVGTFCQHTSLALGETGSPRISYICSNEIKYAHQISDTWDVQTIEGPLYYSSGYTSLALDAAGDPHISYHDAEADTLKYARLRPFIVTKQATQRDGLHTSDPLTYTLTLSGSITNARLWDPLPASVQYVTDSLTSTLSPPAVYSPTAHAVVWQGVLPAHGVQTIHFQVTPVVGAPGELSPPIVNTATLTDLTYDRSASATVIVNGKHVYLPVLMR